MGTWSMRGVLISITDFEYPCLIWNRQENKCELNVKIISSQFLILFYDWSNSGHLIYTVQVYGLFKPHLKKDECYCIG